MKYYPIVVRIDDQRFSIEDVKRWASGDLSSISGLETQVLTVLAQLALSVVDRWEKEHKGDLSAEFDVDTVTGLHLECRDLRTGEE